MSVLRWKADAGEIAEMIALRLTGVEPLGFRASLVEALWGMDARDLVVVGGDDKAERRKLAEEIWAAIAWMASADEELSLTQTAGIVAAIERVLEAHDAK